MFFFVLSASAQGLRFDELKLSDGTVFKDAAITVRQPDGVVVLHSNGVTKVDYELLPTKIVKQIGSFDWRQADDFREGEKKTMFTYIITGDGNMAMPVKSDLNYIEFRERMKKQFVKIHPKGRDTIWKWGVLEFINPEVWMPSDYANHLPALLP